MTGRLALELDRLRTAAFCTGRNLTAASYADGHNGLDFDNSKQCPPRRDFAVEVLDKAAA